LWRSVNIDEEIRKKKSGKKLSWKTWFEKKKKKKKRKKLKWKNGFKKKKKKKKKDKGNAFAKLG